MVQNTAQCVKENSRGTGQHRKPEKDKTGTEKEKIGQRKTLKSVKFWQRKKRRAKNRRKPGQTVFK